MKKFSALVLTVTVLLSLVSGFTFAAPAEPQTEPPAATSEPLLPADPAGPTDAQAPSEPSADPSAENAPGGAPEPDVQPAEPAEIAPIDLESVPMPVNIPSDAGEYKVEVKINDEPYSDGKEYHKGDSVQVDFYWPPDFSTDPNSHIDDSIILGEQITVPLGDFHATAGASGDLSNASGQVLGHYYVDGDNNLVITFEEEFRTSEDRRFHATLAGIIPTDPTSYKEGEPRDFTIGGETFNLTPTYEASGVSSAKSMTPLACDPETGALTSRATVTLNVSGGDVTDLALQDILGEYLQLSDDPNWSVKVNGVEKTLDTDYTVNASTSGDFSLDFNGQTFSDGDEIVVEHDVTLDKSGLGGLNAFPWNSDPKLTNTVSGTYTDSHSQPQDIPDTNWKLSITPAGIEKSGEFVMGAPNVIEWTLKFTSGFLGDLSEYTPDALAALGIPGFFFSDTLGGNQSLTADFSDLDLSNIPLTDNPDIIVTGPDYNGSYTYEFVFRTETDNSQPFYTNNVTIDITDVTELADEAEVGVGWDFEKQPAQPDPNADGTMDWVLDVEVPNGIPFDYIEIVETPQNDGNADHHKQSYTHQFVPGSILVNGHAITNGSDGITLTESESGFTLRIDYTCPFIQSFIDAASANHHFDITYKTKAVGTDGTTAGSTDGSYTWTNSAERTLQFTDRSDTHGSTASYSREVRTLFEKSPEGSGYSADGVFDWSVTITSSYLIHSGSTSTGALFSPEGLTVDLEDTLPDNNVYVPGSARATLTSPIDGMDAILSQNLRVTDNGDGTISIHWDSTGLQSAAKGLLDTLGWYADAYLKITYQTRIDDFDELLENKPANSWESYTFTNTVDGQVNGQAGTPDDATVSFQLSDGLKKVSEYPSSGDLSLWHVESGNMRTHNGKVNLFFSVELNEQCLSLGENGTLTLKDTLGQSLELLPDSVKLYKYAYINWTDTWEEVPRDSLTLSYDPETNIAYFTVPDGTHYKLTYWTALLDEAGTVPADAHNDIEISLHADYFTQKTTFANVVLAPWGEASDGSYTFTIYKYTNGASGMVGLPGAEFRLIAVSFDPATNTFTETGDPIPASGTNDEKTQTNFSFRHWTEDVQKIYKLTETKAPDGYLLDPEPCYFIFDEYSGADREQLLAAGVEEIPVGRMLYFENEPFSEEFGDLTVSKTVVDNSGEEITTDTTVFTFTVTLSDDTVTGTYGDMDFTDGVATVTLKTGESKTALDLPAGISYTVEETEQENYTPTEKSLTGEITADTVSQADFVNLFTKPSEFGSLTVSKTVVDGSGEEITADATVFTFTVTLSDDTVTGTYGDMDFTDGVATVTLKTGESKTALDLPAGISYTVEEAKNDDYSSESTGAAGSITANDTAEAHFTNTKKQAAQPSDTPAPTDTMAPTDTPAPTDTMAPTNTPAPSDTAAPSGTPAPTDTAAPSDTPAPTDTTAPSDTPAPSDTAAPSDTPAPSATAKPVTSDNPSTPDTGDDSQIGLWLAVLAASITGLGLAAVTAVRRGKHNR